MISAIPLKKLIECFKDRHEGSLQAVSLLRIVLLAASFFFLSSSLFIPTEINAETLPYKSYTTAEGLAHDRVNRIVRDSRGFMWFCTAEGLSRFDSYAFKNYTQDDGLPHRAVMDLLETRTGEYWIATGDGVVLFDPLGVSPRNLSKDEQNPLPLMRVFRPKELLTARADEDQQSWYVSDLVEMADGRIYVASTTGIYQLQKSGADWQLDLIDTAGKSAGRDAVVLLRDSSDALWAGSNRGLIRILPNGEIQTIAYKLRVESMLEDTQGHIWVGTGGSESEGLYVYSIVENEPQQIEYFDSRHGLTSNNWMNALIETANKRIFVGMGSSLCEYTPQADKTLPQFTKISAEGIVSLGEDSSGNLWFGTAAGGTSRLARQGFVTFDENDGLSTNVAKSIIRGKNNEIYIISNEDTVSRFDGKRFVSLKPFKVMPRSWGENQVTFQDSLGDWWVAAIEGLQHYAAVNRFEDLAKTAAKRIYTKTDGLSANEIFRLFEDSNGDIWISTIGEVEDTLHRWERKSDRIYQYTSADNLPAHNAPTAFEQDRRGNLWIGYYGGGLVRYRAGKFERFTGSDGLPTSYIADIFADSAGRLWIATSTHGIIRIDDPTAEKPTLTNLTTREGLSSNQTFCITEDKFGRIYLGTGRGINRLDLLNNRIKSFTKADGLPENVVKYCMTDGQGKLWFGVNHGLANYTPFAEETITSPPIFIADLHINGSTVRKLSELGEINVRDLNLASEQRQIQVDFFALGFNTGESLRYQYKLNETDWSEPVTERTVNLNLSPGNYNFVVRAINADGGVSKLPASVTFTIAYPIWQRWWVLLLAAAFIALLIYAVYRYRLQRLLELEKVRTRIATDLHDDIGSSLSQIAILSEVVQQKIDKQSVVNEPLKMIAGTSREMVDSMSDIVWAINPNKDHLSDLVHRMRRFASELLELKDISYRFTVPDNIRDISLGADLRREIYLIFKESINNLIKHSEATEAGINVNLENGILKIEIKDNGRGFDPHKLQNGDYNGFGGNGLPNIKRRAATLGGELIIESAPGKGTQTIMRVPVGKTRKIINAAAT